MAHPLLALVFAPFMLRRHKRRDGAAKEPSPSGDARSDPRSSTPYLPFASLDDQLARWLPTVREERARTAIARLTDGLSREVFAAVQANVLAQDLAPGRSAPIKYLDVGHGFKTHVQILLALDLDRRDPVSILDIGAGGGHFLALARAHGHAVVGLNPPEPLYAKLFDLFGIQGITGYVRHRRGLPQGCERYDLIVIKGQVFDTKSPSGARWDVDDWTSFIGHLAEHHLCEDGELFISLNRTVDRDGERDYLWELIDLIVRHGGVQVPGRPTAHISGAALASLARAAPFPWIRPKRGTKMAPHRPDQAAIS